MKWFDFLRTKEKTSFTWFIFSRTTPINLAMAVIAVPLVIYFFDLTKEQIPIMLMLLGVVFAPIQLIFGTTANFLFTSSIGNQLSYWRVAGLSKKDRTSLYEQMMQFPLKKTIETYVLFLVGDVTFMTIFQKVFHVDQRVIVVMNILLGVMCYLVMLMTYQIVEMIIFNIVTKLIDEGVSEKLIARKKVFGLKMKTRFVIYVMLPIFFTSLLIYAMIRTGYPSIIIHEGGRLTALSYEMTPRELAGGEIRGYMPYGMQISRMVFLCIFSAIFVIACSTLFFLSMRRYSDLMAEALSAVDVKNVGERKVFPVDLSSEFSYSMHLINRLIYMFQMIIQRTEKINNQINDFMTNLSSTSRETSATAIEQMASVEEILVTMENTGRLAESIETKVGEVIKVAENTMADVDSNTARLNENLEKMREITEINQTTVTGIENLYTQINSINDITNLINSVASQTKIIAFNAELETGGMTDENVDFHVVAMEIRELADKTMNLTKEITEEIRDIQEAGRDLIETGQECMERINEGNKLSVTLKQRLQNVNGVLKAATVDAAEVNNFIFEQTSAFDQIKETLEQINLGVKNFTESTKTITDTVEVLQKDSNYLKWLGGDNEIDENTEEEENIAETPERGIISETILSEEKLGDIIL